VRTNPPRWLSRPDQLAALVSPARQELLDALSRLGTVSIAEIATVLGRPADGLYYHLRALHRVGLVEAAGERTRGGRRESTWRAAAPQFGIRYPDDPARRKPIRAIVGAMLRLGGRDFSRAVARNDVRVAGDDRELWALRTTGWLGPAELRDVNRRILALSAVGARKAPRGRLYAITILLTPIARREREVKRAPSRKRRT